MGWPQITLIVFYALSLGISLAKHGEPREDYNFLSSAVSGAIAGGLLYWGGFFS